jgi:hypothetical protein
VAGGSLGEKWRRVKLRRGYLSKVVPVKVRWALDGLGRNKFVSRNKSIIIYFVKLEQKLRLFIRVRIKYQSINPRSQKMLS